MRRRADRAGLIRAIYEAALEPALANSLLAAVLDTLESLRVAVALIDLDLRIVHTNTAALRILAKADGIGVYQDRLVAASAGSTSALRALVTRAAADGGSHAASAGSTLPLPRPSGLRPFLATVVPLLVQRMLPGPDRPVAVVFLADPESGGIAPDRGPGALGQLFGLTAAEERVVSLVAEGQGLPHVARSLGVSTNTIRTHLGRALEKTGTSRQAELAQLVEHVRWQQPRDDGEG